MKRKATFLKNLSLPLVAAPMFLISGPTLVIEACKNGVIGAFPALNQRTTDGLDKWLTEIENSLKDFSKENGKPAAPYAVNLISHSTNPRLQADFEICVKHKVPIIITSMGAVPELVNAVHDYGGLVFHDVISFRHAQKAIDAGVDGLILITAGAGGHTGTLNPFAFIGEIRNIFDGTIILSGCMTTGRDVAAALQMGADLAYLGTRFINTAESQASELYRKMIMESGTSDIVNTAAVTGVPANFLRSSLEAIGITKEQWDSKKKISFDKEMNAAQVKGSVWNTIWSAGHGVANVQDVLTVKDLLVRLNREFRTALLEQRDLLENYG